MKEQYQAFFERCCEQRLQGWLTAEGASGGSEQASEQLSQFMAYLDQSCLDLASKRLITEADRTRIDQALLGSGIIETMPQLPVWFHLEVPQPVFDIDPDDQEDPWANERIVALFFRAPFSRQVLDRVLIPPLAQRRPPKGEQAPQWYEWRLDLIDPGGIFFSAMQYYYDLRTGHWRKMEESTCPVDECTTTMDQELGYETIVPCPTCQRAMDYYSRWIATCLHLHLGEPLYLKSPAWEIRKRAFFSRASTVGAKQKGRRRFRAKIQGQRKKS